MIKKQLTEWTVIGPVPSPPAVDRWIPLELPPFTWGQVVAIETDVGRRN